MFWKQYSPKSAVQISSGWLQQELRRNGHLPQGRVQHFECERWTTTDVAEILRIKVAYRGAAVTSPRNLVIKLPLPAAPTRVRRMARREIKFYRDVAPATSGLSIPTYYGGECAPRQVRYHLILEDLTATHSTVPTHALTEARCAGIVDGLATVHARCWRASERRIEEAVITGVQSFARARKRTEERVRGLLNALEGRVSAAQHEACVTMIAASPQIAEHVRNAPQTIIHGDAHPQNFLHSRNGEDRSAVVIDWQFWRQGTGVEDLAYLFGLHFYPPHRRTLESALVRRYHDELCRLGVRGYRWEDCWADYCWAASRLIAYPAWQWAHGMPADRCWGRFERALLTFEDMASTVLRG